MPSRDTRTSLRHILESTAAIESFLTGVSLDSYRSNLMIRSATERQLQILTEAVFRLGENAAILMPSIDWRSMRGLGNFIRHEYDEVSDEIIWEILHQQLPLLQSAVREASPRLDAQAHRP